MSKTQAREASRLMIDEGLSFLDSSVSCYICIVSEPRSREMWCGTSRAFVLRGSAQTSRSPACSMAAICLAERPAEQHSGKPSSRSRG